MPEAAIETYLLCKKYGAQSAVKDLTLRVNQGEVFGFLGPNGAGKSTTVKMLLALIKPTRGEARLFGQPPDDPRVRSRTGFLPEHFRFHEWLRAQEFLEFHGRLYGIAAPELNRRIPELLELVGLAGSGRLRLSKFSKGMLQRIGLAQAMLNQPQLIFLDEPTSGLDPLGRRLVRDIIRQLKAKGVTIFLNSHFLSEVEVTCDRVAFINHGQVLRTELMAELLNHDIEVVLRVDSLKPGLKDQLARLGTDLRENGATVSMRVESEHLLPEIANLVHRHGARLFQLSRRHKSLEEIYVDLIEGAARENSDHY